MISISNSPVTLTSGLLTQSVQLEIHNRGGSLRLGDGERVTSSVVVNVTKDELSMCRWKFKSAIHVEDHVTITSELLDVVNNSDVKVILDGVVLDPDGRETGLRDTKVEVMKKHSKIKLVLRGREPGSWVNVYSYNDFGCLTARLRLTIEYLDRTIPCLEGMKRFSEKSFQDFSQTMKELLASPSFTNAKIACGDGVEIAVNKEILANRSPVFEAMFRRMYGRRMYECTDMKEAATGVVEVTDICGKSMKVFVEYLTTGKLDESWKAPDVVTDLARAADKYGIEPLRSFLDDGLGEESLVRSNLELLNMAADCGYKKAEMKIAANLGRHAKSLKTRDEFFYEVGIRAWTTDERRKITLKTQLLSWINSDLSHRHHTAVSNLELVNLAADLNLDEIEKRLMEDVGKRLESARSRDEVMEVLGIPQ